MLLIKYDLQVYKNNYKYGRNIEKNNKNNKNFF